MAPSINETSAERIVPAKLYDLLTGDYRIAVDSYCRSATEVLLDNRLEFFPGYTNHGLRHIQRVLEYQVKLIPSVVWDVPPGAGGTESLLSAADAFLIITSTLIHDIGMHLSWDAFISLIKGNSTSGRREEFGDIPWPSAWHNFCLEAKKWDEVVLERIFGPKKKRAAGPEHEPWNSVRHLSDLKKNDTHKLFIGDFIRRHHPRIAHEVALCGFPGIQDSFKPLGAYGLDNIGGAGLAELSGVVARSHGIPLRDATAFVGKRYPNNRKPLGCKPPFAMALLRVADYLDLKGDRAPRSLLRLRNPASRFSVQEWETHQAIADVQLDIELDRKIWVEIHQPLAGTREPHSLKTHLMLRRLFRSIQEELDQSSAVLSEFYGGRTDGGLNLLQLAKSRIESNLDLEAMHNALPYVPLDTQIHCHPHLARLFAEPLYGNVPQYGIRELMQNAVDACRERQALPDPQYDYTLDDPDDPDVLIELVEQKDESWLLRVSDHGVGMTLDTIHNYFLHVGSSYRDSQEWRELHLDDNNRSRIARSGYFGVGVIAAFILGSTVRVQTRNVGEATGYEFEVQEEKFAVEVRHYDKPTIGTIVEVTLTWDVVTALVKSTETWDWFAHDAPRVKRLIKQRDGEKEYLPQSVIEPVPTEGSSCGTRRFLKCGDGLTMTWTPHHPFQVLVNGIKIMSVTTLHFEREYRLSEVVKKLSHTVKSKVKSPGVNIRDESQRIHLNLQRDSILDTKSPIWEPLKRDVLLDYLAFLLSFSPTHPFGSRSDRWSAYGPHYPLIDPDMTYFSSPEGFAPFDPKVCQINAGSSTLCVVGCSDEMRFLRTNFEPFSSQGFQVGAELFAEQNCLSSQVSIVHSSRSSVFPIILERKPIYKSVNVINLATMNRVERIAAIGPREANGFWRFLRKEDIEEDTEMRLITREGAITKKLKKRQTGGMDIITSHSRWVREHLAPIVESLSKLQDKSRERGLVICEVSFDIKSLEKYYEPTESRIFSEIWHETIGPRLIPFDQEERADLITSVVAKEPRIKEHMEKWQTTAERINHVDDLKVKAETLEEKEFANSYKAWLPPADPPS